MIAATLAALAILDDPDDYPVSLEPPVEPLERPAIYDALVREFATGRDASGRFVRRVEGVAS
jgi:hypothetical protein